MGITMAITMAGIGERDKVNGDRISLAGLTDELRIW